MPCLAASRNLFMDKTTSICTNCHIGTLQRKSAPHAAWHGDEFVVVPSLAAWTCDVCGQTTFDAFALEAWLPLIGPVTDAPDGGDTGARRPSDPAASNDDIRTRRRA